MLSMLFAVEESSIWQARKAEVERQFKHTDKCTERPASACETMGGMEENGHGGKHSQTG